MVKPTTYGTIKIQKNCSRLGHKLLCGGVPPPHDGFPGRRGSGGTVGAPGKLIGFLGVVDISLVNSGVNE